MLAFGLLIWRCADIFSDPPANPGPHPLSEIVSAIAGPGNAQISETASGELLILLNGPVGAIDPAMASQLTGIVQTISATGTPPILQQFPFAQPTGFHPTNAELAELSALGLLAMLAFFLGIGGHPDHAAERPQSNTVPASILAQTPPPPFDGAPVLTPIEGEPVKADPRALADAQSFAKANPDVTAKVIKRWIRARGFNE